MLKRSCPECWNALVTNVLNIRNYGRRELGRKGRREERNYGRKEERRKGGKEERDSTLFANPNFSEVTKSQSHILTYCNKPRNLSCELQKRSCAECCAPPHPRKKSLSRHFSVLLLSLPQKNVNLLLCYFVTSTISWYTPNHIPNRSP